LSTSTDTAFALGALPWGPGCRRPGTYLLTFALADDVAGTVVIAPACSARLKLTALGAGLAILGAVIVMRRRASAWA